MTKYNIRCCCTPDNIFGTLELSYEDRFYGADGCMWPVRTLTDSVEFVQLRKYTRDDGRMETAVYSDDRPLEFWKNIKGYEEYKGEVK